MPKLTPTDVIAVRTILLWAIRALAIALMATGSYLFLKKLLFATFSGQGFWEMLFQIWEGIGEEHSTYRGLALVIVGAALTVLSRPLVRWVVQPPSLGCPRCGYAGPVGGTCPECGQDGLAE